MRRNRLRFTTLMIAVFVLAAAGARAALLHFPTAAECAASGRTVDITFRHCESADGYVEIREHAVFHVRDAASSVAILLLLFGGPVWLLIRQRRKRRASDTSSRA